jgi:hypothetical protein
VLSIDGSVTIFNINPVAISQMLALPENPDLQILQEEFLIGKYRSLDQNQKVSLLQRYMGKGAFVPNPHRHIKSISFSDTSRESISMMCLILGYDHDKTINETILGFMAAISPPHDTPLVKFNYAKYLADAIHLQFENFNSTRCFRYQSYLVYLILYFQSFNFKHIETKTEDELGNPSSVTEWTPLVRKHAKNEGFTRFVDKFMYTIHIIFLEIFLPKFTLNAGFYYN